MKCNFVKANKEVCGNNALLKDTKCFWHSKKVSDDDKNKVRSAGGKSKIIKTSGGFDYYKLDNITDVNNLNTAMINAVLQNKIDLRVATGIAYMLNLSIKGIELSNIENKINEIEKLVVHVKLPEALRN